MWRSRLGALAVVALVALSARTARAQDSNYWSQSYGTRARLLGGVVTGSSSDISSVFYNPGALALSKNTELLLAGSAYQYQRIQVQGGSGVSKDIVTSNFGAVPSLFAGEMPRMRGDRWAYSFLTRQAADIQIDGHYTTGVDASSPLPNPTFAALQFQLHQNMSENWFGVTWSHALNPNLGFGVSPYLAVRSQQTVTTFMAEGLNSTGQSAILDTNRDFNYLHYRLLAKLGLSGIKDSLTYGVALTTPSLGLFGGGATHNNVSLVDQTGAVGTVVGASYQEDLKAEYRSPLGTSVGASYGFGSSRIHAAAEWYAEVPQYTVLPATSFLVRTPTSDSTVIAEVKDKLDAVFNFGVGLEHRFSPTLVGFASYHSDQSGRKNGQAPGASITSWDLSHVTGGTTIHAFRSDFALGLNVAFGNQPAPVLPPRPDGKPSPQGAKVHEMITTVSLGWKITF